MFEPLHDEGIKKEVLKHLALAESKAKNSYTFKDTKINYSFEFNLNYAVLEIRKSLEYIVMETLSRGTGENWYSPKEEKKKSLFYQIKSLCKLDIITEEDGHLLHSVRTYTTVSKSLHAKPLKSKPTGLTGDGILRQITQLETAFEICLGFPLREPEEKLVLDTDELTCLIEEARAFLTSPGNEDLALGLLRQAENRFNEGEGNYPDLSTIALLQGKAHLQKIPKLMKSFSEKEVEEIGHERLNFALERLSDDEPPTQEILFEIGLAKLITSDKWKGGPSALSKKQTKQRDALVKITLASHAIMSFSRCIESCNANPIFPGIMIQALMQRSKAKESIVRISMLNNLEPIPQADGAIDDLEDAILLCEKHGSDMQRAIALFYKGAAQETIHGDWKSARRSLEQSEALAKRLGFTELAFQANQGHTYYKSEEFLKIQSKYHDDSLGEG